jgi:hypothetical protein
MEGLDPIARTGQTSELAVTGTVAVACFAAGLMAGWLLRTVAVMAEISRAQERMQVKVRYWQSEALYARRLAEHLARQLTALGYPPRPDHVDPPQDGR